jgi:hypothetical protein
MTLSLALLTSVLTTAHGDPLNPDPSVSADPANTFYSPGLIGFLGTFILVVGAILIIFDMVRRVRRINYRAQIQERLAAEQAAKTGTDGVSPASNNASVTAPASAPKAARTRPAPPAKPTRKKASE